MLGLKFMSDEMLQPLLLLLWLHEAPNRRKFTSKVLRK
jgi:hypothetical protein